MPRGEWRLQEDFETFSYLTVDTIVIPKGSDFILLDTDSRNVKLALKGKDNILNIGINEFHKIFKPNWRDSSLETFCSKIDK